MSLKHHPSIITKDLVFYFDAANNRSYSGTGRTVNGLIGGLGITRIGGTAFSTQNLGSLYFTGQTGNYMPFNIPNLGNTITVEMFAKINNFDISMPFGFLEYDVLGYLGALGYNTNNTDLHGLTASQVTGLGISNNWASYHFEMRTDVSYTNNKIYINGVSQSLSKILADNEVAAKRTFNSGIGRISGYNFSGGINFNISMNLALFKVYNRALTQEEINLNFNAFKGRFGL